jgi:hypothetical protein
MRASGYSVNTHRFDPYKQIDQVANTDFPEELYWQLELREYDIKISEVRNTVSKFNIALASLARAANLTEAALMAFLGYPDAAYKVWRVEYALKASQKMRLCKFYFHLGVLHHCRTCVCWCMFRKVLTVTIAFLLLCVLLDSFLIIDLRVELSLSNAYSNADSAREACPNIVSLPAPPIKPSAAQAYFGKYLAKNSDVYRMGHRYQNIF